MNDPLPVFVIDDESAIRKACQQTLELAGYEVHGFERPDKALVQLGVDWPGVVVSDIRMPRMDGHRFLQETQCIDPDLPVILITGHGDISMAVEAMRDGAYDFIEKPFSAERLADSVRRALDKRTLTLENRRLRSELALQDRAGPRLIGTTPIMQRLRMTVAQIAPTQADVLIFGETGTGKEMVARTLHEQSQRNDGNFVAVNCGALPEHLLESELFGHEAGAFTDAKKKRIGKFEHASGGTLFLDEIESMPLAAQVRLLRVLQDREIERLGSNTPIPIDIRVLAATKVDLRDAADRGEFREDLYYRLNVVTLALPPLRERRDDIPLLFHHFVLLAGTSNGIDAPAPRAEQMHVLLAREWPGNVRELRNLAERYVLLGAATDYDLEQLVGDAQGSTPMTLPEQVECFERNLIEQQLRQQHGNLSAVMASLGLPRKTLSDKMAKYGLDKDHYR